MERTIPKDLEPQIVLEIFEEIRRPLWVRITASDWLFRWRSSLWRMHRIRRWKCW